MRQFTTKPGVFRASKGGKVTTLLIYDEIGNETDIFPVNPTAFAQVVANLNPSDELVLRINSPGGNVFAGMTMYNTLRSFPGRKTVQIDGVCASIASVLAMAADEITIADNAFLMIHNPHIFVINGDSKRLKATAKTLDDLTEEVMIPAYQRSGKNSS